MKEVVISSMVSLQVMGGIAVGTPTAKGLDTFLSLLLPTRRELDIPVIAFSLQKPLLMFM